MSPDGPENQAGIRPLASGGARGYALTILMIVSVLNLVDRQIMNILAEPIKRDLGLADWQLGVLTGFAFALFYSLLGLPIARYAEHAHRPRIIAVSMAVWSLFTVLCGYSQNILQLVLMRIGVGAGEAGCTPAQLALTADYAPPEKRSSAIAFVSLGTPIGFLLGTAIGGLVADAYGWRAAFLIVGAPGLFLALVVAFTLPEPRQTAVPDQRRSSAPRASLREALGILAVNRTFALLLIAVAIKAMISSGQSPFTASFLLRNHAAELAALAGQFGLGSTGFVGICIGLVGGFSGLTGIFLGGKIGDRYGSRDARILVLIPAVSSIVSIPICLLWASVGDVVPALLLLALQGVVNGLWYGPVYAVALSIVPAHMRATTAAILLLAVNLVGPGVGPVVVGLISDIFAQGLDLGIAEGLRWAMIINALPGVLAGYLFWRCARSVRQDMI